MDGLYLSWGWGLCHARAGLKTARFCLYKLGVCGLNAAVRCEAATSRWHHSVACLTKDGAVLEVEWVCVYIILHHTQGTVNATVYVPRGMPYNWCNGTNATLAAPCEPGVCCAGWVTMKSPLVPLGL